MTLFEWKGWNWENSVRTDSDKNNGKFGFFLDALLHGKGSICEKYDDLVSSYTEVDPKDNKVKSICKTKNIANCAVGNTGSLNRCIAEFILDLAFESKQSLLPVEYQSIKYTTEDFEKFIIITEGGMCNRSSSAL